MYLLGCCTNTTACKHMHLIHMQNTPASPLIPSNTTTEDHLAYYARVTGITSEANAPTCYTLRKQIEKRASDMQALCDTCESTSKLQKVYEYLGLALGELCNEEQKSPSRKRKASNQKRQTQPRFYSTHKKRKVEAKSLCKPSDDEVLLSQQTLYNTETAICGICFREEDQDNDCNVHWISCCSCLMWVHSLCANVASEISMDYEYVCQYCSGQSLTE